MESGDDYKSPEDDLARTYSLPNDTLPLCSRRRSRLRFEAKLELHALKFAAQLPARPSHVTPNLESVIVLPQENGRRSYYDDHFNKKKRTAIHGLTPFNSLQSLHIQKKDLLLEGYIEDQSRQHVIKTRCRLEQDGEQPDTHQCQKESDGMRFTLKPEYQTRQLLDRNKDQWRMEPTQSTFTNRRTARSLLDEMMKDKSLGNKSQYKPRRQTEAMPRMARRALARVEQRVEKIAQNIASMDINGVGKPMLHLCEHMKKTGLENKGLDNFRRPLADIREVFREIIMQAEAAGFRNVRQALGGREIHIATLCSGTESPLLALSQMRHELNNQLAEENTMNASLTNTSNAHNTMPCQPLFNIKHDWSVEIDGMRQAWIQRNFDPPYIFRDINEIGQGTASTAYAGMHKVPGTADIWVAGVSCVGFSVMNAKNDKNLSATNESAQTFSALVRGMRRFRPPMVLIENVENAPWIKLAAALNNDEGFMRYDENKPQKKGGKETTIRYPRLWARGDPGYSTFHVKLDSRKFYVPQTRTRGYMICVDRKALGRTTADVTAQHWAQLLTSFARPASCSVQDFMLHDTDPRLQQLRYLAAGQHYQRTESPWLKCEARYERYRWQKQLGNLRPMTQWVAGGNAKAPDHFWQDWCSRHPERIADTFEISWLRCAVRGYDALYKMRVWELSQNIDRFTDGNQLGVIPCITPTGMPFNTFTGRPLTGLENLALQGLPIDEVIISSETNKQLQELAGNAMTSTVVGPAIMAALIAGAHYYVPGAIKSRSPLVAQIRTVANVAVGHLTLTTYDVRLQTMNTSNCETQWSVSLETLQRLASQTVNLCYCETTGTRVRSIQKCRLCNHTACYDCGNIPRHEYELLCHAHERRSLRDFVRELRRKLPSRLTLDGMTDTTLSSLVEMKFPLISSFSFHDLRKGGLLCPLTFTAKTIESAEREGNQRLLEALQSPPTADNSWRPDFGYSSREDLVTALFNARSIDTAPDHLFGFLDPAALVKFVRNLRDSERLWPSDHDMPTRKEFLEALKKYRHCQLYADIARDALKDVYSFKEIECTRTWRAKYEGGYSRLELLFKESEVKWLLYAKPDKNATVDSLSRELLRTPIARMTVQHDDLLQGVFELRLPSDTRFGVTITERGKCLDAWASSLGITRSEVIGKQVWDTVDIELESSAHSSWRILLDGSYIRLPECGMAESSLFRKVRATGDPLFLFLDPSPLGPWQYDHYVFSTDKHRLGNNETREIFASVATAWRPTEMNPSNCAHVRTKTTIKPSNHWDTITHVNLIPFVPRQVPVVKVVSTDALPSIPMSEAPGQSDGLARSSAPVACADENLALLSCQFQLEGPEKSMIKDLNLSRDAFTTIEPRKFHEFFHCFSWLFEQHKGLQGFSGDWRPIGEYNTLSRCDVCAPRLPHVKWSFRARKRKPMQSLDESESSIDAETFEDVDMEIDWFPNKRACRSPNAVATSDTLPKHPDMLAFHAGGQGDEQVIQASAVDEIIDHSATGTGVTSSKADNVMVPFENPLQAATFERQSATRPPAFLIQAKFDDVFIDFHIAINVTSMLHRLMVRVNHWGTTKFSWRLDTQFDSSERAQLPRYAIPNNDQDIPSTVQLPMNNQLLNQQRKSLTWMINQESGNVSIQNLELEEATLPEIGWLGVVRATAIQAVRGGVVADGVGYGKTVTSLALMHAEKPKAAIYANTHTSKAIPVKATLVIVPQLLATQWKDAALEFLGPGCKVVVIATIAGIGATSVDAIMGADIVITSRQVFSSDIYYKRMAAFAGIPEGPRTGQRAMQTWLNKAMPYIERHANELKTTSPQDFRIVLEERHQSHAANNRISLEVPSTRLKGTKFEEANLSKRRQVSAQGRSGSRKVNLSMKSSTSDSALSYLKVSSLGRMRIPHLHMFSWYRVILDEYTYAEEQEAQLIIALKAHCRWVLSGTPPLEDFANVRQLASLVGIVLGNPEDIINVLKHADVQKIRSERTAAETFRAFSKPRSVYWHKAMHELAQLFLTTCARKNLPDQSLMPTAFEHIVMKQPTLYEYHLATEVLHSMISQNNQTRRIQGGREDHDRATHMNNLMKGSVEPVSPILRGLLTFKRDQAGLNEQAYDGIITTRAAQRKSSTLLISYGLRQAWYYQALIQQMDEAETKKEGKSEAHDYTTVAATAQTGLAAQSHDSGGSSQRDHKPSFRSTAFVEWMQRIKSHNIVGDYQTNHWTRGLISSAKQRVSSGDYADLRKIPPVSERTGDLKTSRLFALTKQTAEIRGMVEKFRSRLRSIRYAKMMKTLHYCKVFGEPFPYCEACNQPLGKENGFLNSGCGHVTCTACRGQEKHSLCCVSGCAGSATAHLMRSFQSIRTEEKTDHLPRYGTKIDMIVDAIQAFPEKDQVLVFVQYNDTMDKLVTAFTETGISHYAISGTLTKTAQTKAMKEITAFQYEKDSKKRKVLILNCAAESAAGANLTGPNRVVFVTPLNVGNQAQWDHQYTQAIGRARRMRQKKTVHTYHFLLLTTVDFDLFNKWNQKQLHYIPSLMSDDPKDGGIDIGLDDDEIREQQIPYIKDADDGAHWMEEYGIGDERTDE